MVCTSVKADRRPVEEPAKDARIGIPRNRTMTRPRIREVMIKGDLSFNHFMLSIFRFYVIKFSDFTLLKIPDLRGEELGSILGE
jgi:hypothetical protein